MQQGPKLDHYQLAAECFGHESDVSLASSQSRAKFTEGQLICNKLINNY